MKTVKLEIPACDVDMIIKALQTKIRVLRGRGVILMDQSPEARKRDHALADQFDRIASNLQEVPHDSM